MRGLKSYLLLSAGVVPVAFCWMELLYRIRLYRRYGSQPFLNHVADGYFGIMYLAAVVAAAILICGLVLSIRSKSSSRIMLYLTASGFAVAHMAVLFLMNWKDMLVTYSEFAENMGP